MTEADEPTPSAAPTKRVIDMESLNAPTHPLLVADRVDRRHAMAVANAVRVLAAAPVRCPRRAHSGHR